MKRSELETSSYLKDDCLTIQCTIEIVQTRDEDKKPYVIPVPPSDMNRSLKGLKESEISSDITFSVGNESFTAHKLILAARSPVFRAQFFGLVGNPGMETVVIEEFEPFAFKVMLLFLYSDELPEPSELSDSDSLCTSTTLMQHLLAAADRYDIAQLKLMCEARLSFCLDFASKPENLGEVMKSDGYADLEKSCPSLLTYLLQNLLTGMCIGRK
ncbi:hypothetical protein MKW92_026145 [Papaver armeniacum]|nr:hypothetical protein MKW92_026145 [Papaver armeniacum]